MLVRETLSITCDRPDAVRAALKELTLDLVGTQLIFDAPFEPGRHARVVGVLNTVCPSATLHWSVYSNFEPPDFKAAPLRSVSAPDVWFDGFRYTRDCPVCNKPRPHSSVEEIKGKVPKVTVAGMQGLLFVGPEVRREIEESLRGARFVSIGASASVFHLTAEATLGRRVLRPDEMIEPRGVCPGCGVEDFRVYFGPLRFCRGMWNEDLDFAWDPISGRVLMTEKALSLLKKHERRTKRMQPVFIDD